MNHIHNQDQEIDVPSYFLCPISLEIMKDPVTVCTGITYDRESIETWVFSNNNTNCPVTKQPLNIDISESFLTPNHTLRRLIQSWCTINASYGIERFPTPKPPATKGQFLKLISEATRPSTSPSELINCLSKIKSIASESNANKRCLETTPGVLEFLAGVIILGQSNDDKYCNNNLVSTSTVSDDALRLLASLEISDELILKKLLKEKEGALIDSLTKIMQKSSYELRAYAILMLKQLVQVADPTEVVALRVENFIEVVQLIKDEISPKTTKAALKTLALACLWGRNRVRIVEAGAVPVMVDILMESKDRRMIEMVLAVLDHLCGCAEGRAELLCHGAGIAVVSKKILRVSHYATEKGVKILFAIAKFSGTTSVVQEMVQLGLVTKLCLVLQVDCEAKTKDKVREIFKLHASAWRNSPCGPPHNFGSIY